jgi:hypothetical protein
MANDRIKGTALSLVGTAKNGGAISITAINDWDVVIDTELVDDFENGDNIPITYEGKPAGSINIKTKDYGSLSVLKKGDIVTDLILTVGGLINLSDGTPRGGTAIFTLSKGIIRKDGRSIGGTSEEKTPLKGEVEFGLGKEPGDPDSISTLVQTWGA